MQSDQCNSAPFGSPWALWFPSRGHLCSQSDQYFAHLKMLRSESGEEREKGALGRGSRYKVPEDRENLHSSKHSKFDSFTWCPSGSMLDPACPWG